METSLKKLTISVVIHFIFLSIWMAAAAIALIRFLPQSIEPNVSTFYSGVITLATGAMVAIFLAVFYSDAKRIEFIRKQVGAINLFVTVLAHLIIIVSLGLLLSDNRTIKLIILCILSGSLLDLSYIILKLTRLALRPVR